MPSGDYACRFAPDGWDEQDWIQVKSPRWDHPGGWVQRGEHIENRVPPDASPAQLLGVRAGETYSSMVLARAPVQDVRVRAVVSFDDRMAPLVVLAGPLGTDHRGAPEYRQQLEIALFDEGVNVWHHTWTEAGGPAWNKAAWWACDLAPATPHELVVERRGPNLSLAVDNRRCGCRLEGLPAAVRPGLTGCEGVNRFYEFAVSTPED